MGIITRVEQTSSKARLTILAIYALVLLGAIVTLYPFAIMVSTSVTSSEDYYEYRLIPRYLYSDDALFAKYLSAKYSQNLPLLRSTYGRDYTRFSEVPAPPETPPETTRRQVEDFRGFLAALPNDYFVLGFNDPAVIGLLRWRYVEFLTEKFADLAKLNDAYDDSARDWTEVLPPFENPIIKSWNPPEERHYRDFLVFKRGLPLRFKIPVTGSAAYRQYVRHVLNLSIEEFNHRTGETYQDFSELLMPDTAPEDPYHRRTYERFLEERWPDRFRTEEGHGSLEQRYHAFLRRKFDDIAALNAACGTDYERFAEVSPPLAESDAYEFREREGAIRWDMLARNYRQVLYHITVRGSSFWNTVILCTLVILTQLTVNPLAAYALSRMRMPATHRILLFLLATMAFPAEVTMIPNYLMLRDLHLLNTYAAIVLPTMVNGFMIFLLKGFFDSLPEELFEAGRMDGATEFQMFWMIALPLSKPIMAVQALHAFTFAYSSFMWAFIVLRDESKWTLMVHLYELQVNSPIFMNMAVLVVASIPTLVVFAVCQKVILRGIIIPTMK